MSQPHILFLHSDLRLRQSYTLVFEAFLEHRVTGTARPQYLPEDIDPFDLAIVEVRKYPDRPFDGIEFARSLRAEHPSLPIIIFTYYNEDEVLPHLEGVTEDVFRMNKKGLHPRHVAERIQQLLTEARPS